MDCKYFSFTSSLKFLKENLLKQFNIKINRTICLLQNYR